MDTSKLTSSKPVQVITKLVTNIGKHDLLTLAGALAFTTALSLAPLVLIFLTVVSFLGEHSQDQLIAQIQGFLGADSAKAISSVIENAEDRPSLGSIAGAFGVLMLLISASSVFAQLQSSLNVIWETNAADYAGVWGWIRKRVLSMGMVLAIGFLAAVSLILSSFLSFFVGQTEGLLQVVNVIVSILVFTLLFALIFAYLPDVKMPFRKALIGGAMTALLFAVGKYFIGLYLGQSAVSSSYGAAGSLVVLLIWVYYSSFILFAGAELTQILVGGSRQPKEEMKPA